MFCLGKFYQKINVLFQSINGCDYLLLSKPNNFRQTHWKISTSKSAKCDIIVEDDNTGNYRLNIVMKAL